MKVFVSGATGFVGRMVVARLLGEGHRVVAWTRSPKRARGVLGAEVLLASPETDSSLQEALSGCDAVVNLQGENIFAGRWTKAQKGKLVSSRVDFTNQLAKAIRALGKSAPSALVSGSAVGYYGARVDTTANEDHPAGEDFLAGLCEEWEAAARALKNDGVRVVTLRIGVVLGKNGGALEKMLPPFKLGLGGKLGSGKQMMSWIHLTDLVSLILESLLNPELEGPVNACSPHPVSNQMFTKILAKILGKPALFPVPGPALRLALGEVSSVLLGGQNAVPKRAQSSQFQFRFGDLSEALKEILNTDSVRIRRSKDGEADYTLEQETIVDAPLAEVFKFFSQAENLGAMTPPDMTFSVRGDSPEKIDNGTTIEYDIKLGPVPLRWCSIIDKWRPESSFVDTQQKGPYAFWWHEHSFEARGNQTIMRDTVKYRLPLSFLGRLAHKIFVGSKLRGIFSFRSYFTSLRFPKDKKRAPLAPA